MTAVILFLCLSGAAQADADLSIQAKAAILIDAASGRVLFEQNADERYPMASTTKIMTALIAVEHCGMDEMVTAGPNASGVTGTSIYLSEGEQLTMHQMLQGLMLRSGNDAAVAIAEHIAGDVRSFAGLMNARADMLGADAVFVTPSYSASSLFLFRSTRLYSLSTHGITASCVPTSSRKTGFPIASLAISAIARALAP